MTEHATAHRAGERYAAAIDACTDTHQVCVETLAASAQMEGGHGKLLHLRILQDCAEVCDLNRDMMLRSSDLAHAACRLTAEVCDRCASSCDQYEGEQMARCAEACRRCAAACAAIAGG
jgi:hypothetical protein